MKRDTSLNPTLRFAILIALFVLLWLLAKTLPLDIDAVRHWLTQYPLILSGFLYIALYVGITAIFWFGTIDFFRITGAFLFGPYLSTLLVWIAEILNASILFHISRHLGQEFVQQKFKLKESDLTYAQSNAGFWGALVLRANPLVPFRFMDLGFGLSKLSFSKYFWAVVVGSPLRILGVQVIIAGAGEALFKDPQATYNYLMSNMTVVLICLVYLLTVIIATIVIAIRAVTRKRYELK